MIKNLLVLTFLLISTPAFAQVVSGPEDTSTPELTLDRGDVTVADGLNVTGLSTLTGQVALGSETVAGAGSTVADAAQLSATKGVHQITGANGTLAWKFSSSTPIGSVQILLNTTAGVAKVFAESGGTINGGSADAAFTALTGIKPIICVKTAALTYLCA